MEYVPGIKINRIAALDQLGVDQQRLGRYAVESYFEQILSHGFFHADPKMMHKLKVDPSSKVVDTKMVPSTNRRPRDSISCISSTADATSSSTKGSDMDQESVSTEQGMYYPPSNYYGYYYPGYDGSSREWGDQGYAVGFDGLDTQYPGVQMENGSLLYYMPGYGYVHPPLSPYTQPPIVDVDGQRLGQQPYFASPMLPQVSPPGYLPPPVLYGSEVMPAYSWDISPFFVDAAQTNGVRRGSVSSGEKSVPPAPNHQSLVPHAKPPQSVKSNTLLDVKATTPSLDLPSNQGGISVANIHNQSVKPVNKVSQSGVGFEPTAVLAKGYFPIPTFPAYSNQNKGPLFYPSSFVGLQLNGRGLTGSEKLKTRNKMGGVGDFDPLNEQNRGPRINNNRNSWVSDANLVGDSGCLGSENNGKVNNLPVIRRDQYNLPDFPIKYEDALFFVIKSYGEDDIHKSIKYSVWASTPNGNKRIDSAYQDSQKRCKEKTNSKCPVFLFFSVNASGQFCGVAEMTRKVDFNKSMNFWQQDKCNGFFPVKWHIIKDVPNPQFRHIILENNDNKPVTNSRDTQEVRFPQGIEMLRIFKNYSSKTSILDDFDFYESRQKAMLDKRVRSPALLESSLHNKPVEAIPTAAANESDMPKPAVSNASQLMGSATSKRNHDGQLEDSAE